jgi:hypothetical protein
MGSVFAANLDKYPRGLAFDGAGNLFVAHVGLNPNPGGNILKFAPNGVGTVFAVVPGGNNSGPEFLAFPRPPGSAVSQTFNFDAIDASSNPVCDTTSRHYMP